jgi:hypothetical protein
MTREEAVRRIDGSSMKIDEVDWSRLKLEEVPSEIVNCTHLTELDLVASDYPNPEAFGQLSI